MRTPTDNQIIVAYLHEMIEKAEEKIVEYKSEPVGAKELIQEQLWNIMLFKEMIRKVEIGE